MYQINDKSWKFQGISSSYKAEFSANPDDRLQKNTNYGGYRKRIKMEENKHSTYRIYINKLRKAKYNYPLFLNQRF